MGKYISPMDPRGLCYWLITGNDTIIYYPAMYYYWAKYSDQNARWSPPIWWSLILVQSFDNSLSHYNNSHEPISKMQDTQVFVHRSDDFSHVTESCFNGAWHFCQEEWALVQGFRASWSRHDNFLCLDFLLFSRFQNSQRLFNRKNRVFGFFSSELRQLPGITSRYYLNDFPGSQSTMKRIISRLPDPRSNRSNSHSGKKNLKNGLNVTIDWVGTVNFQSCTSWGVRTVSSLSRLQRFIHPNGGCLGFLSINVDVMMLPKRVQESPPIFIEWFFLSNLPWSLRF